MSVLISKNKFANINAFQETSPTTNYVTLLVREKMFYVMNFDLSKCGMAYEDSDNTVLIILTLVVGL